MWLSSNNQNKQNFMPSFSPSFCKHYIEKKLLKTQEKSLNIYTGTKKFKILYTALYVCI